VALWTLDLDPAQQHQAPLTLWDPHAFTPSQAKEKAEEAKDGQAKKGKKEEGVLSKVINMAAISVSGGGSPPMDPSVRSVCVHKGLLLVGTASSEMFETKVATPGPLTWECRGRGHYSGELWGLATHPRHPIFVTGTSISISCLLLGGTERWRFKARHRMV
jgi:hypothetical protein